MSCCRRFFASLLSAVLLLAVLLGPASSAPLRAQTSAPAIGAASRGTHAESEPAPTYGAVTGHVYLAGSNLPARFVQVALQPIDIQIPKDTPGKFAPATFAVYQTDLNGAFTLGRVVPGTYYLYVKSPGTLSPLSAFSLADLQHPDADTAKRIAATVPVVSVAPGATANVTLTLQRGARLSGTVRFDDGTPYAQAYVSVEVRGPDGKWAEPRASENATEADLEGHWEIGGMPAGTYRILVNLRAEERHQSSLLTNNSSWSNSLASLPIYLGDTTRERDAKSFTLDAGQQLEAQDITIPVSKMHAVTGAVVEARTGQALNAGHVALKFADNGKELASVAIDPESRTFTLPFVLEGEYRLVTKDAREARFEEAGDPNDDPFHQHRKEVTLRSYAPGDMPLVVTGEMTGVSLALTPAPPKSH